MDRQHFYMSYQYQVKLRARKRGFHLITDELINACPDLPLIECGLFNAFIQHSSASLTINENADPTVREDFEAHTNVMVPENAPYYKHNDEGPDDMPAHIKASLYGSSITVPVKQGLLLLGTWQGIYLGEHRDYANARSVIITLL